MLTYPSRDLEKQLFEWDLRELTHELISDIQLASHPRNKKKEGRAAFQFDDTGSSEKAAALALSNNYYCSFIKQLALI